MKLLDLFSLVSLVYSAVTVIIYVNFAPNDTTTAGRTSSGGTDPTFLPLLGFRQFLVEASETVSSSLGSSSRPTAPLTCKAENNCPSAVAARRFPRYGTPEYARQCSWTTTTTSHPPSPQNKDCTILVRPDPIKNNEGISWWVSEIVEAHLTSTLIGCRLMFDYGPDVNIHEVLAPPSSDDDGSSQQQPEAKWAVPPGFQCTMTNKCFLVDRPSYKTEEKIAEMRTEFAKLGDGIGKEMVRIPQYRFAYFSLISVMTKWKIYSDTYKDLERAVPGFDLHTGYACSLASLFRLAPTASQYEPELFTKIFPTLTHEDNLVITVYIRTNYADDAAKAEKAGRAVEVDAKKVTSLKANAQRVIDCALMREIEFLSTKGINSTSTSAASASTQPDFSGIVWMLVSDSSVVKEWIVNEYNGQDTNALVPPNRQRYRGRTIPRQILTTGARGIHTRTKRRTTTQDFAEALIDWYLIGESDVVLSSGSMSFGETGALRTLRPLYLFSQKGVCHRVELVHDRSTHVETNYSGPMMWFPQ